MTVEVGISPEMAQASGSFIDNVMSFFASHVSSNTTLTWGTVISIIIIIFLLVKLSERK